jgi:hypothetical protein
MTSVRDRPKDAGDFRDGASVFWVRHDNATGKSAPNRRGKAKQDWSKLIHAHRDDRIGLCRTGGISHDRPSAFSIAEAQASVSEFIK